jgi:Fe-S cluster assembly iron-binding protein IscA
MYQGAEHHALHMNWCLAEGLQVVVMHITPSEYCFMMCKATMYRLWTAAAGAVCRVFERDGVRVVCDTVSIDFLRGAVLEYEDSLMRSAFQVWDSRA